MIKLKQLFKGKSIYIFVSAVLLVHMFVLIKLVFFPYPELFIYPYLTNHGLKPYSQILDQHFPGLMFLPINFDNLGMQNDFVARVWLIAAVLIAQMLLFFVVRSILGSGKKALLVNLLYLIWQPFFEGWVLWIDSFLPIFLITAFYFLYKKNYLISGLLLGISVVFKQTMIPLSLLIAVYIIWQEKSLPRLLRYLLGFSPPVFLMVGYFILIGVVKDFWYWTVVFNLTVFSHSGTQIPQSFGFISRILVVYIFSLMLLFHNDKRLKSTLLLFLIGSLAGIFDRANFVHLQPSLPFALISTTMGIYSLAKRNILLILTGIYCLITVWWLRIFYQGHLLNEVFFFDASTKKVTEKIRLYTKPGDKIFVFGAAPHLYQMSQTLPAGDIFVFQFPWFFQVAQNRILQGLKNDKPKIIIYDNTVKIDGKPITQFGKDINQYILKNYQEIDNVGDTKVLKSI